MNPELEEKFQSFIRRSGGGSTIEYTENLRNNLPHIFRSYNINSVLDAPCGDMVWMDLVLKECSNINYIGGDIVYGLILKHTKTYEKLDNINFLHLDITEDTLPKADLWILRDVLFHFSPNNIKKVFSNLYKADIKYVLTTTHTEKSRTKKGIRWTQNLPIADSDFGLLNLYAPPYSFPPPLLKFKDCIGNNPYREMGLWTKDQIISAFFKIN